MSFLPFATFLLSDSVETLCTPSTVNTYVGSLFLYKALNNFSYLVDDLSNLAAIPYRPLFLMGIVSVVSILIKFSFTSTVNKVPTQPL